MSAGIPRRQSLRVRAMGAPHVDGRRGLGSRIGRLLVTCMVIGFLALVAAGLAAAWSTKRTEQHTFWVNHTYQVALAIADARSLIEQGETTRRGYLITGQQLYLDAYRRSALDTGPALARIAALTNDNAAQRANMTELWTRVNALIAQRDRSIDLVVTGQPEAATQAFERESDVRPMFGIRTVMARMRAEEDRLLAVRADEQRRGVQIFYTTLTVAAVLLLFVAVTSLTAITRYTRDLSRSRDALAALANSLEDQVAERTADLTRANEEIQRFAYIVSHDLRSPLVNVMGFTAELEAATAAVAELIDRVEERMPEIVTEEARLAAREDLPEAISFIRTSTQKMDRLINAILKLSREGRRVLAAEPVDMQQLVGTAQRAIQHLFDERGATFAIEGNLPPVIGDRLALEQILSNLIENAVKYLDPARPGRIVVRGAATSGRLSYDVKDNGRGIAPGDHQRIFDLFRRSGTQDQPGEGIGLAHVRALAYRLGGTITVESELGKGTTFRLSLPASLNPGDAQETAA